MLEIFMSGNRTWFAMLVSTLENMTVKNSTEPGVRRSNTVTLPKPTVAWRSVSQKWENRATSGFVIGEASGDGFFIMISADGRPIIGRQSADDRQTVGQWQFIKEPSADRHRISAVWRPIIARLSADHKLWFVLYCLQCIYPQWLWNISCIYFIFGFISFDLAYK